MSTIKISDLHPAGSDLFSDSEGFINDLDDGEIGAIQGGIWTLVLRSIVVSVSVSYSLLFTANGEAN